MITAGYVLFTIGSVGAVSLWKPLHGHRVDIGMGQHPKEGSEPFGSLNIFNPRNYDDRGQKLLRWLYLSTALQLAGIALLISTV